MVDRIIGFHDSDLGMERENGGSLVGYKFSICP